MRLPVTWYNPSELQQVNVTGGKAVAIDTRTFAIFNRANEVTHVVFIFEDVTATQVEARERLKVEKQLSDVNSLLRDVIDGTQAVIYIKDLKGTYILINRQYETIFNLRSKDFLGKTDYEVLPKDLAEDLRRNDARVIATKESHEVEEVVIHADGLRHTYISLKFPLMDSDGNVHGLCGISTDITQKRKMERELSAARQMESLGVLAGGLAHDFNNLLGVILMHAENLPGAEEIKISAERASELTRKLLAFGRKQVLAPVALNMNEIVTGMRDMLKSMVGADVKLELELDPNLGMIHADPTQLEQVLMNLCRNASDAMPGGGHILLSTRNVFLGERPGMRRLAAPAGAYIELVVKDSGHGIRPEIRDRIFEPFFTTKDKDKGTGLGLSSVYGILQQSGGDIELESELGNGTLLRVYFPLKAAPIAATQAPAKEEVRVGGNETLLLIEDEPALRQITATILRSRGYTVHVAADAEQTEKVLRENVGKIDLIISDVIMPGENGPALLARLAEHIPLSRTKVLFVSGHSYNKIETSGLKHDSMHFLEKPYGVKTLLEKIARLTRPFESEQRPQ